MTDRPMIFSAPMVRALLDGRKSQTRRVLKLPTRTGGRDGHAIYERKDMGGWEPTTIGGGGAFTIARDGSRVPCPEKIGIWHRTCGICLDAPYQVDDRLWVRETWENSTGAPDEISYRATVDRDSTWTPEEIADIRWRSPIHMPRWASRLTLAVTDVRVQRLQDLSEEDARAEGMPDPYVGDDDRGCHSITVSRTRQFRNLWNGLHGPDAWVANPWVVAVSFTVERRNIDEPRQEAA